MILIIVLLVIAAVGLFAAKALQSGEGAQVVISIDGSEYGRYPLDQDQTIAVDNARGHNLVVIEDGFVQMQEADCPDLICVHHAPICHNHETIICLPHKLVVEVEGGSEAAVDVTAQ
jgi:hypothetical protein